MSFVKVLIRRAARGRTTRTSRPRTPASGFMVARLLPTYFSIDNPQHSSRATEGCVEVGVGDEGFEPPTSTV